MTDPDDRSAIDVARWAAAMLSLDLPAECLPGVAENLAALAVHADRLAEPDDAA